MKFNLKNRPKLGDYPDQASKKLLREYAEKMPEWLEEFDRELLLMLNREAYTTKMVRDIQQKKGTLWIKLETVRKEILGEDTSQVNKP